MRQLILKIKRYKTFWLILFVSVWVYIGIDLVISQTCIGVTHYQYQNRKIEKSFKVIQLTDLHNYEFGKANRRLIEKVNREQPDVIFLTGDMLDREVENTDILTNLLKQLVKIAPVYVSIGNHEDDYMEKYAENELITRMEQTGVQVLNDKYLDLEIKGQKVRLGGLYGYALEKPYKWEDGKEQDFMEKFQDTDRFKILLCHLPEGLLLWKSMEHWKVDLIFSGHVHGGQVRIPFLGGLYDHDEGLFPTYTKGMFQCGHGTMILSAGLGSSGGIPRLNNLPELVVCEIISDGINEK